MTPEVVSVPVATPIEQELNGVDRMIYMQSSNTSDGRMLLDVNFEVGVNQDTANVLTQNRVASATARLPQEVTAQGVTVKKQSPSILLVVSVYSPGATYDSNYLINYAGFVVLENMRKDVFARLQQLPLSFYHQHKSGDLVSRLMADTEQCPDDGGTAGSRTTPSTVPRVRNAAAAALEQLATLAASKLGVQRSKVKVENGTFFSDSQVISLQELAVDSKLAAQLSAPPAEGISVKQVESWKVLGTPVAKVNGRDVVTGLARYPSDTVRSDMLYGRILRPVSYEARLKSVDVSAAERMEGVRDARSEVRVALERAQRFLGLASLLSVVLASVAVALAAARLGGALDRLQRRSNGRLVGVVEERVARGEKWLHRNGFRECRVRYYGDRARIEVALPDLPRLRAPELRRKLDVAFRDFGFVSVEIDARGFRSGSLNADLPR